MSTTSSTRPRRAVAVRPIYDSPSDGEVPRKKTLPERSSRNRPSYRETSGSDSDASTEDVESDSTTPIAETRPAPPSVQIPRRGTRSRVQPVRQKRKATGPTRRITDYKRRKVMLGRPNTREKEKPAETGITFALPPSGRQPPWQTLPYQIMVKIFEYAAYPLYEGASRPTPSIHWLLDISRLSRTFHDAAITTLLHTPPVYPVFRAQGLLNLLRHDQDKLSTNYCTKIRRLDLEVKHLFIRKQKIEPLELLKHTPLLAGLRLYHNHDHESFSNMLWSLPINSKDRRWTYPTELFQTLDEQSIVLREFEWNGRWPMSTAVVRVMNEMHQKTCLRQLERLTLWHIGTQRGYQDDEDRDNAFVDALAALPKLKSLTFHNCPILSGSIPPRLPDNLQELSVVNCRFLDSVNLQQYLNNSGRSLLKLELVANQALDLGFTANLKETTPELQHLHMDLNYVDPTSYHDTKPLWDLPLPNGPPSWPTTLRSIYIDNLREIDLDEAEEFMLSLANAAEDLRDLRHINIKILLKHATWRDRADMRKRWLHLLPAVFKRNPNYHSAPPPTTEVQPDTPSDSALSKRRSTTKRTSTRLARQSSTESDSKGSSIPTYSFKDIHDLLLPTQNMCSTIVFSVSDQRPAAEQYVEADFMDSERSGDEDWNGRDEGWD